MHGGAARITVAAPSEHKLEVARSLGVDETVRVDRADPAGSTRRLREVAPSGFDVVVEATGAPSVLAVCTGLTRTGGTVLVYGMADERAAVPFSPYQIFARELTVKGSFAQIHCFDRALLELRTGRVRTDGIITDRFQLDRFDEALEAVADPAPSRRSSSTQDERLITDVDRTRRMAGHLMVTGQATARDGPAGAVHVVTG
jgi:D-arabinitol dehydrogenase (NADP+)